MAGIKDAQQVGEGPPHPQKYLQRSHRIPSISIFIIIILAESFTFFDLIKRKLSPSVNLVAMGSGFNGVSRRGFPAGVEGAGELHVLAVDDSLVDRKVIERLLRISSCKVTAVESGRRALQCLGLLDGEMNSNGQNKLKVNLIITDYSMPGMTGYELMKKIKESSRLSEIPVVIMSSENILAQIDRCLEEGAKDYIVKPVKLSDVRRIKDSMVKASLKENIATKRGIAGELKSINNASRKINPNASLQGVW